MSHAMGQRWTMLALALMLSQNTAAAYSPGTALHSITWRGACTTPIMCSTSVAADEEAAERLWAGSTRPLLRIGKSGAAATHASGLSELCASHPYVSVRLTGRGTKEALDQLLALVDEVADGDTPSLTLLATRKPRKGGMEALFSQAERASELCSSEYHAALAKAQEQADLEEEANAETYKDERAAKAIRQAQKADKAKSRLGLPRQYRAAHSQPRATMAIRMMAKDPYPTVELLEAAVRQYIDEMPEGQKDDPTLPSPLNYKELSFHGRDDLVAGCMAHGGYLKVSNDLGVPVRIGVERDAASSASSGAAAKSSAGKKAVDLFNLFGKAG